MEEIRTVNVGGNVVIFIGAYCWAPGSSVWGRLMKMFCSRYAFPGTRRWLVDGRVYTTQIRTGRFEYKCRST